MSHSETMSQPMRFLPNMRSDRVHDAYTMTASQFVSSYHEHLQDANFTALEFLTGDLIIRPIFDRDDKRDTEPSVWEKQHALDEFVAHVTAVFAGDKNFSGQKQIRAATRHGWVDGKYKLSFHAFVKGYKIKLMEIKRFLEVVSDTETNYFDLSIYKEAPTSQQLFTVVGGRKSANDARVMLPVGDHPLQDYLAQHLDGAEQLLDLATHLQRSQPTVGPTGTLTSKYMLDMAGDLVRELGDVASTVSKCTASSVYFRTHGTRRCPHDDWHSSNNFYVQFQNNGDIVYYCLAEACVAKHRVRPVVLGQWDNGEEVEFALEHWQEGDRGMGEIAHRLCKDEIKVVIHKGSQDYYCFNHERCLWEAVSSAAVKTRISNRLEPVLRKVLKRQGGELDMGKKIQAALNYIVSNRGLSNVIQLGFDRFRDSGLLEKLDAAPHLLSVRGGVVDLRTGILRPRTPEDYLHIELDVEYDAEADTRWVEEMMATTMAQDMEMVRHIQKLLGYAITGEVSEELFVTWSNSGRNGKSLLLDALADLMGPFFKTLSTAVIVDKQVSNLDAEKAKIRGARIASFNESQVAGKLRIETVCELSGGDAIPIQEKYKDPDTIKPRHLCLLTTNHLPELSQISPAICERFQVIPFPVFFTDLQPGEKPSLYKQQRDDSLKVKLKQHKGAFLTWLVQGAVLWYASRDLRRNAPDKVKAFTKEYLAEQDKIGNFLTQCCEAGVGNRVLSADLLLAYRDFVSEGSISAQTFVRMMKGKGFEKRAGLRVNSMKGQGFVGIKLKS